MRVEPVARTFDQREATLGATGGITMLWGGGAMSCGRVALDSGSLGMVIMYVSSSRTLLGLSETRCEEI